MTPFTSTLPVDTDLSGLSDLVRGWTVALSGREGEGKGSGVIWHPDGLLVSNAHVVGEARRMRVTYSAGSQGEARVLARDDQRDIALL